MWDLLQEVLFTILLLWVLGFTGYLAVNMIESDKRFRKREEEMKKDWNDYMARVNAELDRTLSDKKEK